MKNLIKKVLAAAAGALFLGVTLPSFGAGSGDIWSIFPCDENGNPTTYKTAGDEPYYGVSEPLYVCVRLWNARVANSDSEAGRYAEWEIAYKDESKTIGANDWTQASIDWAKAPLVLNLFTDGSGSPSTAVMLPDKLKVDTDGRYTDLVFKYTTKAGDFALPARLATWDGSNSATVTPDGLYGKGTYFYITSSIFTLRTVDPLGTGRISTSEEYRNVRWRFGTPDEGDCAYGSASFDAAGYNYWPVDKLGEQTKGSPEQLGFYIQTVYIDGDDDESGIRHEVAEGDLNTDLSLSVLSLPDDSSLYVYLWSDDENSFYMANNTALDKLGITTSDVSMQVGWDGSNPIMETRKVQKIPLASMDANGKIKVGIFGKTRSTSANLVLSASDHYNYKDDSAPMTRITDYVTVKIAVGEPLPPSLSVTGPTSISATSSRFETATDRIALDLGGLAAPNDITVQLVPTVSGGADWKDYVFFAQSSTYAAIDPPAESGEALLRMTIKKGASATTVPLNVYALGSDAGGTVVTLVPMFVDSDGVTLLPTDPSGFITGDIKPLNISVASEITSPDGAVCENDPIKDVPVGLLVSLAGAHRDLNSGAGFDLDVRLIADNANRVVSFSGMNFVVTNNVERNAGILVDGEGHLPQVTFDSDTQKVSQYRIKSLTSNVDTGWVTFEHEVLDQSVRAGYTDESGNLVNSITTAQAIDQTEGSASITIPVTKPVYDGALAAGEYFWAFLVATEGSGAVSSKWFKNCTCVVGTDNVGDTPGQGVQMTATQTEANFVITPVTAMTANFKVVVVKNTDGLYRPSDVYAAFPSGEFFLTVENVPPVATGMWMYLDNNNATDPEDEDYDGTGAFSENVMVDKSRAFRLFVSDSGYDKDNGLVVKWTVLLDGKIQTFNDPDTGAPTRAYRFTTDESTGKTLTNKSGWFNYTFTTEDSLYTIRAEVWDAKTYPGKEEETNVPGSVIEKTVYVTGKSDLIVYFDGTNTADNVITELDGMSHMFTIKLADGKPERSIDVELTITPANAAEADPGTLVLSETPYSTSGKTQTYRHTFNSAAPWELEVEMGEIDGVPQGTKGYTVTAAILTTDTLPSKEMTAQQYYRTDRFNLKKPVKIINAIGSINENIMPVGLENNSYTNMLKETGITWALPDDVTLDLETSWSFTDNDNVVHTGTGLRVQVMGSNVNEQNYMSGVDLPSVIKPSFRNGSDAAEVYIFFYDRNGASVRAGPYIYPQKMTKLLYTVATGPGGANLCQLSAKYANAKGRGKGHTWVKNFEFNGASSFYISWDCGTLAPEAKAYAYGYKAGATDSGGLDGNRDIWLDANGDREKSATGPGAAGYYISTDDRLDSFFYGWITAGEPGGTDYTIQVSPSVGSNAADEKPIKLPTEKGDDASGYQGTYAAAVFAREKYMDDNLGDINSDGIPDYFMRFDNYVGGALATPDGAGGELVAVNTVNADEDFYPNDSALGSSTVVPGAVSGWQTKGQPFTALREIRGYDDGLNFGMFRFNDDELELRKRYGWISTLKMSNREKRALLREVLKRRDALLSKLYNDEKLTVNGYVNEVREYSLITNLLAQIYYKGAASGTGDAMFRYDGKVSAKADGSDVSDTNLQIDVDRVVVDETTGADVTVQSRAWFHTFTPYDGTEAVTVTNYIDSVVYTNTTSFGATAASPIYIVANPCDSYGIDQADIGTWLDRDDLNGNYSAQQDTVKAYIDYTWEHFETTGKWGFTVENRTDPTTDDTDGDGMPDGYEYFMWYCALVGSGDEPLTGCRFNLDDIESYDDVITSEQIQEIYNPNISSNWNGRDTDNDGITDIEEFLIGTSPVHWDTDRDGLSDLYEVMYKSNPLAGNKDNNADANLDGDFMAYWKAGGADADPLDAYKYIYAATNGTYWILDTLYPGYVNTNADVLTVAGNGFEVKKLGNAWIVPTEDTSNFVARVAQDVTLDFDPKTPIVTDTVTLLHHQVHNYFGFDPRTAWFISKTGTLSPLGRWKDRDGTMTAGVPQNTTAYSAIHEYLVLKYRYIVGLRDPAADKEKLAKNDTTIANIVASGMTNPNANFEDFTWGDSETAYAQTQHGADTDGDRIPDGWELYIGVSPNNDYRVEGDGQDDLYVKGGPESKRMMQNGQWVDGYSVVVDGQTYYSTATLIPVTDPATGLPTYYSFTSEVTAGPSYPNLATSLPNEYVKSRRPAIKNNGVFEDGLTLEMEYAGTDASGAYEACETIYANYPGTDGSAIRYWFNKFFPTDPRNPDTDGDLINDGAEFAKWTTIFTLNRWGSSVTRSMVAYSVYGHPSDNGGTCIAGGGLNPLTIDTDLDGLPDPWERQFPGVLFNGKEVSYGKEYPVFGEFKESSEWLMENYGDADPIRAYFSIHSFDETNEHYQVLFGMDGTVNDAKTSSIIGALDCDWDGDGLQNWQEYMIQAIRCFRYDDDKTPLLGRDCPDVDWRNDTETPGAWCAAAVDGTNRFLKVSYTSPYSKRQLEFIRDELGYKNFANWALENPDYLAQLGYFAPPPREWDNAAQKDFRYMLPRKTVESFYGYEYSVTTTQATDDSGNALYSYAGGSCIFTNNVSGTVTSTYTAASGTSYSALVGGRKVKLERVMLPVTTAQNYISAPRTIEATTSNGVPMYYCTDPRVWDTDNDGMDDYWELFHGLNPILGDISATSGYRSGFDVIGEALRGTVSPWNNAWIGWANEDQPEFDPMKYPWLMGLASCDADGDGLRNYEESILANMTNPGNTHTDPTPVWMTDATAASYDLDIYTSTVETDSDGDEVWDTLDGGQTWFVVTNKVAVTDAFGLEQEDPVQMVASPSYTALYYVNEISSYHPYSVGGSESRKIDGSYSYSTFPYTMYRSSGWDTSSSKWIASFEMNEGYDTDNDWRSDSYELAGSVKRASDPLDFEDMPRRQSIWFGGDGNEGMAMSVSPTWRRANGLDLYKQFTVEAWVRPENVAAGHDQYIVSRATNYGGWDLQNTNDVVRLNFAIGIDASGRAFTEYQDDTEHASRVTGNTALVDGNWVHLAGTYDGTTLVLYINGVRVSSEGSGIIPANGTEMVRQDPQVAGMTSLNYTQLSSATVLGGRPVSATTFSVRLAAQAQDWSEVATDFYKGSVSEVRMWDGARTPAEMKSEYTLRYTQDMVKANRLDVFTAYVGGARRNDMTGTKVLPAELVQHYDFNTLPGSTEESTVALTPPGFETNVLANVRNPETGALIEEMAKVSWWGDILESAVGSKVYTSPYVIPWVQDTVAHLPRLCGSFEDSVYWSQNYAGYTPASYHGLEEYDIPNSMNPYNLVEHNFYTSLRSIKDDYLWSKLAMLNRQTNETANANEEGLLTEDTLFTRFLWDYRRGFDGEPDLIPLGSAYAKRSADYWDGQGAESAWISTGADTDGDELPDWWEDYARETYSLAGDVTPDVYVVRDGLRMLASEAYIRDLAAGLLPTKTLDEQYVNLEDINKDGLPDWWQNIYGVKGGINGDDDNDGLSNYTEYMLSELFDLGVTFSPIRANSVSPYDIDYFFRIGQLYAGEIFTDHDFMEDAWEDGQGSDYTSRFAWDANLDKDEDGWSNFAECNYNKFTAGIIAPHISHILGQTELADMPVPTLSLTLRYNGDQPLNQNAGESSSSSSSDKQDANALAKVVVQTFTKQDIVVPDATFVLSPGETVEGEKFVGMWSDRVVRGTLAPGYIDSNSIDIQFMSISKNDSYNWRVYNSSGSYSVKRGTYEEFLADVNLYGTYGWTYTRSGRSGRVELIAGSSTWESPSDFTVTSDETTEHGYICFHNERIGTINLITGAYSLDLSSFQGWSMQSQTSVSNSTSSTTTANSIALENACVKILYSSTIPKLASNKLNLYLDNAFTGYVKEGKNTIVAFYDINGDSKYTLGEPMGTTQLDVGWFNSSAEIELTDTSPIISRCDLEQASTDRRAMYGTEDGDNLSLVAGELSGGRYERVRVVRTLVNGSNISSFGIPNRVIFDKTINLDQRPYFYEGDVLENGAFDLDWDTFQEDVLSNYTIINSNIDPVEMTYRIVLGNGTIAINETNNLYTVATVRRFDSAYARTRPVVESPGPQQSAVFGSRPTFQWTMKTLNPDTGTYINNNSYTAFKVQVMDGSSVIWDSGIRRAPARNLQGVYSFTPDIYADDLLEPGKNYSWRVSMYNAKFRSDYWSVYSGESANNTFRMNALTNSLGKIRVCAKYFGPSSVLNAGVVRIEAFTTPDFSGSPVARTYVRDPSSVAADGVEHTVNATLVGLDPGIYYVRGYIDMNTNARETYGKERVRDSWESWGYVSPRDGYTADMFMPTAIVIDDTLGTGDLFDLYIEDVDTNGNCLPDAWEMVQNKGRLDNGTENVNDTLAAGIEINQRLTDNLQTLENGSPAVAGLAAYVFSVMGNSGIAALVLDADFDTHSSYSLAAAAAAGSITTVANASNVEVTAMDVADDDSLVELTVSGDASVTTQSTPGRTVSRAGARLYSSNGTTAGDVGHLEGVVEYTDTLTPLAWQDTGIRADITVENGKFTTKFAVPKTNATQRFYRVVIQN